MWDTVHLLAVRRVDKCTVRLLVGLSRSLGGFTSCAPFRFRDLAFSLARSCRPQIHTVYNITVLLWMARLSLLGTRIGNGWDRRCHYPSTNPQSDPQRSHEYKCDKLHSRRFLFRAQIICSRVLQSIDQLLARDGFEWSTVRPATTMPCCLPITGGGKDMAAFFFLFVFASTLPRVFALWDLQIPRVGCCWWKIFDIPIKCLTVPWLSEGV